MHEGQPPRHTAWQRTARKDNGDASWLLLEINQDGPLQDSDGDNLAMELWRDPSVRGSQTLQCLLGAQNSSQNKVTSGRTLEVGKGDQKKVGKEPATKREASQRGMPFPEIIYPHTNCELEKPYPGD